MRPQRVAGVTTRLAAARRKGQFYAKKLAWMSGAARRFQTPVGMLTIPREAVSPTIFYHLTEGDYEEPERRLLEEHLSPDDRVIELGAGMGFMANLYGRRCPNERHLAIEASPEMSALAATNTSHLTNVQVLNAVAARPAPTSAGQAPSVPFHIYESFWGSSTEPLHLTDPERRLVRTVQVPVVDLDALIAEYRCTTLVCDIEGGEFDLLRTFELNVPTLLIELHWRALGMSRALSVLTTLESRGYRLSGSPDVFLATRT